MLSSRYKLTPTSSSPTPTPTHTATTPPDEAALPPPPSLDTPANHQYPDPTLSHTSSRTLAMRCLRETSSMTLSATTIFDMNNALDQALSNTTSELRAIKTTLPRVDQLLTNLQKYNTYLRSRQRDACNMPGRSSPISTQLGLSFLQFFPTHPPTTRRLTSPIPSTTWLPQDRSKLVLHHYRLPNLYQAT